MRQPCRIAGIGGGLISMIRSLVITPAVHFYLSGKNDGQNPETSPA